MKRYRVKLRNIYTRKALYIQLSANSACETAMKAHEFMFYAYGANVGYIYDVVSVYKS